ncbi:MAG: SGNH/GDSL hydrolase family protein [Nitrospinota bacterium]|nr:SGNH/GDSL hydrolase family protein [Nitrospinota bacterium]
MKINSDTKKNLILLFVTIIITLVMFEGLIRIVYGNVKIWQFPQMRHISTSYGYKLEPNQTGTYTTDFPITTNSWGFRDDEWKVPKPKGVKRIMTLGDSLTFGNGAKYEEIFPTLLENKLKKLNSQVEVLNTSAIGWTTYNEVDFFTEEGISYEPDILILCFFQNDYVTRPENVQITLDDDGRRDARPEWLQFLPYKYIFLLKRSALISFVRLRLGAFLNADKNPIDISSKSTLDSRQDITDTYSYIADLKEYCDKNKIKLIVVYIPAISRFAFPKDKSILHLHMAENMKKNGITFFDLAEPFWNEKKPFKLYMYPWDNHLNAKGHKLIADQLYTISVNALEER